MLQQQAGEQGTKRGIGAEGMQHADPHFDVLGIQVNAIQIPGVIARMESWITGHNGCRYIAVTGMHGITEAQHDAEFAQVLNSADLVVPDGMPLVWLGRKQGHRLKRRVYGPELMQTFCSFTGSKYRHFFYGGAPGVAESLAKAMQTAYCIKVAGTFSPPYRKLSDPEHKRILADINSTEADVLWIGLSTPKQEHWMHRSRSGLNVPAMVGVGAAFDIHTGRTKQAPRWMREHGLEWSFRLYQEPRRLWRRYLIYGSEFVLRIMVDSLLPRKRRYRWAGP